MKLVLSEFGLFLGRKRNRYYVSSKSSNGGNNKKEVLSTDVEQVHILNPGVSVSASALRLALKNQTLVVLGSRNGWPHGFVIPARISGTIRAKREQFLAYQDFRGAVLAKKFASGKAFNQRNLLRLLWKNRVRTEPAIAEKMYRASEEVESLARELGTIQGANVDSIRTDIMNREARASKAYWDAISIILPSELGFPGRKTRGATDPVNAMLNFGYKAILFVECWKSIYYSGLDPYAGYLHAERPGKPSLALDFMEEFRQHVVDRVILSILGKKMLKADEIAEFDESIQQQRLSRTALQVLTKEITGQLEGDAAYHGGQRIPMKNIIQNQSRLLVNYLINPATNEYTPFELVW